MEVSGQLHTPAALLLDTVPGIPWIQGYMSPRASLDVVVKRKDSSLPLPGNKLCKSSW